MAKILLLLGFVFSAAQTLQNEEKAEALAILKAFSIMLAFVNHLVYGATPSIWILIILFFIYSDLVNKNTVSVRALAAVGISLQMASLFFYTAYFVLRNNIALEPSMLDVNMRISICALILLCMLFAMMPGSINGRNSSNGQDNGESIYEILAIISFWISIVFCFAPSVIFPIAIQVFNVPELYFIESVLYLAIGILLHHYIAKWILYFVFDGANPRSLAHMLTRETKAWSLSHNDEGIILVAL